MHKIDFVLPWVDGNDVQWQKKKNLYMQELTQKKENDHGMLRYRDTNTLKYVLRSIEQFCPWYNKIHLITEGHFPEWLDIEHPKINLITHEELYFDRSHLPTFNSSSIEMNLPNLKDVSEKFVYLNDDFIILNFLEPERFFRDDKPVDFLHHGWIPRNKIYQLLRDNSGWVKSLNNAIELINSIAVPKEIKNKKNIFFHPTYGAVNKLSNFFLLYLWQKYFFIHHWHHPQPYKLSLLKEVYQQFKVPMLNGSKNKFRKGNDLTQYLYRYYHLTKEKFYPYYHNDGTYANITSYDALEDIIEKLNHSSYNFVAVYDNYTEEESQQIVERLTDFLEKKFPNKASFEK